MLGIETVDEIRRQLSKDDFLEPWYTCFTFICELRDRGIRADIGTLMAYFRDKRRLEDLGPTPQITLEDMEKATADAESIHYHVETVRDETRRRAAMQIIREAAVNLQNKTEASIDTVARAEPKLLELMFDPTEADPVLIVDAVRQGIDRIEERAKRTGSFVKTGLADIDKYIPGLDPGELIVVGARPGIGKSAFALCLALNIAGFDYMPVYFASLEMSRAEIGQRFASLITGVNMHALKNPKTYRQDELDKVRNQAVPGSAGFPLYIDDNPTRTVQEIVNAAKKVGVKHNGIKAVIVDYLQLVRPDDPKVPRQQQVGQISRGLKVAARTLKCPVIALAQLNREVESRGDGVPKLSDLREAGNIEQDADTVMFLHRDRNQDPKNERQIIGCNIEKQRNGPTGNVTLVYEKSLTRFVNHEPEF